MTGVDHIIITVGFTFIVYLVVWTMLNRSQ
jgi:hypothetical protein